MADNDNRDKEHHNNHHHNQNYVGPTLRESTLNKQERNNFMTLSNGSGNGSGGGGGSGKAGSGDDADSLEEIPLDIGEHYLVRRSDDSWRKL